MATYTYCDGFNYSSVTVTATFGSCSVFRDSTSNSGGVWDYRQTWSLSQIKFTLNHTVSVPLTIRWRYKQTYKKNDVDQYPYPYWIWINTSIVIPANVLSYTIPNTWDNSYYYDCHEIRYVGEGAGDGVNTMDNLSM